MTTSTPAAARRIALLGETGGPGGAERMMLQLADELGRRGHEVIPVLPSFKDPWLREQFRARGLRPETFDAGSIYDVGCLAQMVRILSRRKADVVHSHEFFTSVYGGAAALLLGRPHVITMHGGRYYNERALRRTALRWSARRSRAVVGVSAATAQELAAHLRLPEGRVHVVHNGVRPEVGDPAAVRRELGLGEGERLVVAVGNLLAVKGHVVLLRAMARLRDDTTLPPWRIAVAGEDMGEEDALRRFVAEHGLADRVHLLGYRADVANVLAAADLYVMPSLSEGLPMALVEAMFAGRPVVASRIGGIPEVVTDGVDGVLVAPGDEAALADALRRLLADDALRARIARAGRERVESQFGVERMVDAYERLYGVSAG